MLRQTILHLPCKHELLFVKLQEDLQVHEVLLILLLLLFCGIPINNDTFLLIRLVLKDGLACLNPLTLSLFIAHSLLDH